MATAQSSSSNKRCDSQRFTDVSSEPDRVLPPLPPTVQLHSTASPSLYEVVKSIHHLVEDLPNHVASSLEKCKKPKDGLTHDESAAIFLYTQQWPKGKMSFYTMFNRTLRDENRIKLVPFHQYLNLFMSAFNKLPSIQDRIWRGETGDWGLNIREVWRDPQDISPTKSQPKSSKLIFPSTIHVWWGVSSCTDMIHVTSGFLDATKKLTLFNIKCINGKIIKNHSEFPNESETVLPPGTYLKVKSSLNATPDLCIVDLEEIVPTPEEIAQLATAAAVTSGTIFSPAQISNIYVLWLDLNVNKSHENKKIQEKLKKLFENSFKSFEKSEDAVSYMEDKQNQHFLLITSGQIGRQIVPEVNNLPQLQLIIVYCVDREANEKWSRNYKKVKAVVIRADEMIENVQKLYKDVVEQQTSLSSNSEICDKSIVFDITDELPILLSPMRGLQDRLLLPLEESLQGIMDIIPDLKQYIKIAMMNCKNPVEGLTQNESAAIRIYTMEMQSSHGSLYRLLNQDLRSESGDVLKKWFPYLKLLLHALNKLPSYKGTVWRGINLDLSKSYKIGQTMIWWDVSSTAPNMSILESNTFMGKEGARTIFSIECKNGKRIKEHTCYKKEDEIVLLPGFCFEVTNKLDAGKGLHIIHLKEIDPPYELY